MATLPHLLTAGWLLVFTLGCPQEIRTLDELDAAPKDRGVGDVGQGQDTGEPTDTGIDGGFEADASCVQACGGRVCGNDPVCNLPCGRCTSEETCSAAGQCLTGCSPGSSVCADGFGFNACGYNPALGLSDRGPRIPCAVGDTCSLGRCEHQVCVPGEVMLVIDHSSVLSFNSTWLWVKEGVSAALGDLDQRSTFGLRLFPGNGCQADAPLDPQLGNTNAIQAAMVPPGSAADRPIEAALTGLATRSFGPARDGQAVVLLTAGDETCGSQAGAVREASMLFRAGIRTYVVGIHNGADPIFLDDLARAGGTLRARHATSLATLTATLTAVFDELALCDNPHAQVGSSFYHSCGLRVDGTLSCWGRDLSGESSPPAGTFTDLGVGNTHACAVRASSGEVECWGRDERGQLLAPAGAFKQVVGGDQHECGLRLDGTAECWGHDDSGQATAPSGTFKRLTAGAFFSCGILMDDTVDCWGSGILTPPGPVRMISGGSFHLCALLQDGSVWCSNGGEPSGSDFLKVSAGDNHDCAIRADHSAVCWGANGQGQSDVPLGVYADIDPNYEHSCGVRLTDDAFVCWGSNSNGQANPP